MRHVIAVAFLLMALAAVPCLASGESKAGSGRAPIIPTVLTKLKIAEGITKIDLLRKGKLNDLAVRAKHGTSDSIILLTGFPSADASHPKSALRFVTIFEESSYAIETVRRPDDGEQLMTLSYILRAKDTGLIYLLILNRSPTPDMQSSRADVKIDAYVLRDSGAVGEYSFQKLKEIDVRNFNGVDEKSLCNLEEKMLHTEIKD